MSHGLATLLKYPRAVRASEAVTVRGYTFLVAAALLVVSAGPALATGPIPHKEVTVAPEDLALGVVRDEIFEKQHTIGERCTPRPVVLCVGPYDPDIDIGFGNTGVMVFTNGTNATAGHDPSRHFDYGPYHVYAWLDDMRVCESGCKIPNSVYGHVEGNVTVVVYYAGRELSVPIHLERRDLGLEEPGILAPSCDVAAWYDCLLVL